MRDFFLTTARLAFSVWSEEDLNDALELWGNAKVTKLIVADGKMSEKQVYERLKKEIEMYKNYNIQYWPIYLKETYENKIFEIGIHLKDNYWGAGIATEACLAMIKYAFANLNAKAIFAGHNPKNIASAQLLKKLGFSYTHDEFYPPTGLYHPSYLMTEQEYKIKYINS